MRAGHQVFIPTNLPIGRGQHLSDWGQCEDYWYDDEPVDSFGGECNYEKALEYLPGGSKRIDVEKATDLMRSAAS